MSDEPYDVKINDEKVNVTRIEPKKKRVVRKKKVEGTQLELNRETGRVTRVKKASPLFQLYRGATKVKLINDLAEEKYDRQILAGKYGVTQGNINEFYVKYKDEVDAQKERIEKNELDEYALLSVHKKHQRVQVYQAQIDYCDDYIAWSEERGRHVPVAVMRLQQNALRAVAEEMGDLKQNVSVEHVVVDHTINGLTNEEIKALE